MLDCKKKKKLQQTLFEVTEGKYLFKKKNFTHINSATYPKRILFVIIEFCYMQM